MSHCPGSFLEDWLTDWYRLVVQDLDVGSGIRWMYTGQLILTKEQFAELVAIHAPAREMIENKLSEYSEEENGSWRDYCGYAFDSVPKEILDKADAFIAAIRESVPKTKGLLG